MDKKIYFLINSLEGGGAERVLTNILPYLAKNYQIDLITLKDKKFYDLPSWINYIPLSKTHSNLWMLLRLISGYYFFKLKKLLQQNNYHKWVSFLEFSNFLNILVNKNAIISFRTFFDRLNPIYKFFIKLLYPKAKLIIFNSKENELYLKKLLNLKTKQTTTIYNPIDFEKLNQLSQESVEKDIVSFIKWKKVFITVWRLIKIKHQNKIIKVLSQINNNWCLLILWDGPEKQNILQLVENLKLKDKVKLLWAVKNPFKYMKLANYFIYASEFEGFPNAVLEAITLGLPVITSNFRSGVRELIDPKLDLNKNINYPYQGPNGIILDLKQYEKQFKQIYTNLNKLEQKQVWVERFEIKKIVKKWQKA